MQILNGKAPIKPDWKNKLLQLPTNDSYLLVDISLRKKIDVYINRLKIDGHKFTTQKDGHMLKIWRLKNEN